MEQQAGDKEEARGGPDWNKFMEMMSSINEKIDRQEEKINSTHEGLKKIEETNEKIDSIKENNKQANENLLKQMKAEINSVKENTDENNKRMKERI